MSHKWPSHEPAVRSAKGKERRARIKADPVAYAAYRKKNADWYWANRDRIRARNKSRYRNDKKYRERILARAKEWRTDIENASKKSQQFKSRYWANPEYYRQKSKQWMLDHYELFKQRAAIRRAKNRDKHRAYCRLKALLLTDGYVREQLSKYHPTKSCKEWTQNEVVARRHLILANRAKKVTRAQADAIRKDFKEQNGISIWELSQRHNVGFSNTWYILKNKGHFDPNWIPAQRIRNITKTQKTFALLAASADIAKAINAINENSDIDPG